MIKKLTVALLAVLLLAGLLPAQQKIRLFDTNLSHNLTFTWNENDTANRVLNFLIAGADRSLTISGDSYIDQDVRIAATPTWASAILNKASGDTTLQFSLAGTPKWTVGLDISDSYKFKIASGDEFGNSHDILNIAAYDGSSAGVAEFTVDDTFSASQGGVCVDGNYIYYADRGTSQVVKIDAITGAEVARSAAVASGDLRYMAYGAGFVYVVNYDASKIRKYDTDLTYIGQSGAWYGMSGLVYWGGYLYACNGNDHDVKKFRCSDFTVMWTAAFGTGSGANQFNLAQGIATDGDYLYVLDHSGEAANNRIVRLAIADGAWVDATTVTGTLDGGSYAIWIAGDWVYVIVDHGASDLWVETRLRADMTFAAEYNIASQAVYQACQYGDYHYVASYNNSTIYKYWFTSSASYTASGITFRLPDEFGQTRDLAKLTGEGNLGVGTAFPDEKIEAHGNIKATLGQLISTVPAGTPPLSVISDDVVPNLNSDQVDGYDLDQGLLTTDGPTFDHLHLTNDLAVAEGGTGKSSFTQYAIPYASASTTLSEIAIGEAGKVLAVNGTANGYEWIAPGGALALDDLTDVNAAAPSDQDVLTWDTATSKWIAQAPPAGGAMALDDLTDVNAPAPDDDDVLSWDAASSKWIPVAGAGGGAPTDAKYIVQEANGSLSAEQSLGTLTTGLLKNTVAASVGTLSTAGYYDYSRHCWIRESFDGLATGSILGLGSYFEAGAWADDTLSAGSTAEVAVKSGADKMLTITNKGAVGAVSSAITSTISTGIGLSGGGRVHFKFKINQNTAGYYGDFHIRDASNQTIKIYFRYSTTWQIAFNNGTTTTKLQDAAKDTWYTVDCIWGPQGGGSITIFIDGTYSTKLTTGNPASKWTKVLFGATSPAGGADCVLDVDDFYLYSLYPLGLD